MEKKTLIQTFKDKGISRVAVYLRKSRDNGVEEGDDVLQKHRDDVADFFSGVPVSLTYYEEIGSSESFRRRTEVVKLLNDVEDGRYDAIAVVEAGRLTKRNGDFEDFADLMKQSRTYFIVTNNSRVFDLRDSIDEQSLTFDIFAKSIHQKYTKDLLYNGRVRSAKQGNWVGGQPPLGFSYNKETKKLEVREDEAVIVREIYRLYVEERMKLKTIEAHLYELGYRGRTGKKIWNGAIYRMFNNEAYIGNCVNFTHREVVKDGKRIRVENDPKEWIIVHNAWEAIVDVATFDKARQLLKKQKGRERKKFDADMYYRGMVYCAECGTLRTMSHRYDYKVKGGATRYSMNTCKKCGNVGATIYDRVDKIIGHYLQENTSHMLEGITEVAKQIEAGQVTADVSISKKIKRTERLIRETEAKILRAMEAFENGTYNGAEFKERKDTHENTIAVLRRELAEAESRSMRLEGVDLKMVWTFKTDLIRLMRNWDKLHYNVKKVITQLMLSSIDYKTTVVNKGTIANDFELTMHLNSPQHIISDTSSLKAIHNIITKTA